VLLHKLCKRIVELELQVTDLRNRPSIFEAMSKKRVFGGHFYDLPASVTAAIELERVEVSNLLQPLREASAALLPARSQPPLTCVWAFLASPYDKAQVFDVTCKTMPLAIQRILCMRSVGAGYVPALLAVAQRLENMCTHPDEFGIGEGGSSSSEESKFVTSFLTATHTVAPDLHSELMEMAKEFPKQRSLVGVHASIAPTSQLRIQATQDDIVQGLSQAIGQCEVLSIILNCNATMSSIAVCSPHGGEGGSQTGASSKKGMRVPETTYFKFNVLATSILRACARGVKEGKKVHVLLLACNMQNLVEEMAKQVKGEASTMGVSVEKLCEEVELCFTTHMFPAGVFLLAVQAYAECNTTSLRECTHHLVAAVKVWRAEHDDMAVNDGAESGKGLPPLESRLCVASLGECSKKLEELRGL